MPLRAWRGAAGTGEHYRPAVVALVTGTQFHWKLWPRVAEPLKTVPPERARCWNVYRSVQTSVLACLRGRYRTQPAKGLACDRAR